jgi:predicted ATPase with chaperone activity
MLARVRSAAVLGIDAYLVEVETDIANGLPVFAMVGLPQGAELSVRFVAQQPSRRRSLSCV